MPATPPDLAHADIGLVAALPIEISAFMDRCEKVRKYKGNGLTFRGGKYDQIKIACVEGGMGFARARIATQALIDAHSPAFVLSVGFSGALNADLKFGDIVIANAIGDVHGQQLFLDLKMESDPVGGLYVGKILTADHLVRTVDEKRELGAQHQALAVDLESLAVAQVCRDAKVRFMAIRVISDDLTADLPPEILSVVGATGAVRIGAAIGAIWKRPGSATDMWKLRDHALRAATKLATFLDGVVVQLHKASKSNT
jgi:adenosylhomocysteine nucleosidase